MKEIALNYGISSSIVFDNRLWREYFFSPSRQYHLSAQGWIDMYNHLTEIGEMNFIKD